MGAARERIQRQQRHQRTQRIKIWRSRGSRWVMNVKNVQETGARSSKLGARSDEAPGVRLRQTSARRGGIYESYVNYRNYT